VSGIRARILVDADACPVKDEVARVAGRTGAEAVLVAASWMRVPGAPGVRLEVVARGFDAVDDWIAAEAGPGDVVVTADIPLAARCVGRGARVITPAGHVFTPANVGEALATRDLLAGMRAAGLESGGPPPFAAADRSRFLQALDRMLHAGRHAAG
jgi:uncharacterized protein YaiI (UPF0178 family)